MIKLYFYIFYQTFSEINIDFIYALKFKFYNFPSTINKNQTQNTCYIYMYVFEFFFALSKIV